MATAEDHIAVVEPLVHADSRFTNITFGPYTAEGGSLLIRGDVVTDGELRDLKRIVESSKPPVRTVFIVDVIAQELRQEIQKGAPD